MSGILNLVVLCPYGRRETIKVTPNSCILQVLEEACKRQKIQPEDFDIRHYNRTLDLSLPIRFANLPNNALLELRPAANLRKDSIVTVCLQLESGDRPTGDFQPSSSVYDVLQQCLKSDSVNSAEVGESVCVYMRQKITGDALKTTTLRSLGLTKGKAIIRLMYRKPEELEDQAHVSSPLVPTTPTEKDVPRQILERREPISPTYEQSRKQPRLDSLIQGENNSANDVGTTPKTFEQASSITMDVDSVETNMKEENEQSDYFNKPGRPINNDASNCPIDYMEISAAGNPVKMESDAEVEENTFEDIGDIKYIGERHSVLYSLDEITDIKKADLPDEFFELTINDVKYLMEDYRRERTEIENRPLLTKEQRQREILHKLAHYNQTVIRVYFPEKLVLQAVFMVNETVQAVSDFIKNYLEDKRMNFYLYITPPKERLNPDKTLLEVMLVPAAVVYFGSDTHHPSYLMESLRNQLSDPRAAALAASESRKNSVVKIPLPMDVPIQSVSVEEVKVEENVTSTTNGFQNVTSHQSQTKVPKWMRLSKQSVAKVTKTLIVTKVKDSSCYEFI